ncbi:similar to pyrroline-5-carboxylate reductase [Cyanidioschyzon merolae strain 10D]|uniref:Similar to pyrroline-5-carboxylate reductase n=1 Tax=Cyanidioschyzon merolae (strain NIES-3377 / 10D) TaxID=280699 RepID=M1VGK1_CYAM1|nr:similar to pyrroline-5-carboxylate reductase [Cyanidioschyzon merolae strain 10D]BAM79808.1 similar to pyrroline-5-carboxylate reductase [Cyanidioschyzon merolae strain 10D]|eukprot:XP_005536094.1 similar to pyrroline-5-carboxylate reductase [Cyanidioschyzon merolae strain 10D]
MHMQGAFVAAGKPPFRIHLVHEKQPKFLHGAGVRYSARSTRWYRWSLRCTSSESRTTNTAAPTEKLGFIGGTGNMGSSIIKGLIEVQALSPQHILCSGRDAQKLERFSIETGCTAMTDLATLCAQSTALFLCVKPAQCQAVLERMVAEAGESLNGKRLISVAAGVPVSALERPLRVEAVEQCRCRVLRCMPNVLVRHGLGAMAVSRGTTATDEDVSWALQLLGRLGLVAELEESLMDATVAAAGSSPAFAFIFMEALTDAAVREGLPRHIARSFVAQTLCGAAQMALRDSDAHFGELRNRVESPGGTTIAGSCALEENGFRKAVIAAAAAAAAKSRAFADRFSA